MLLLLFSWRKSSKTVLLHLGHLGSSSESMTYIRQRGQPTKTMEVVSGLLEYLWRLLVVSSSWFSSVDTHELGGDVGETVADLVGDDDDDSTTLGGGDRFSFKSSFGPLPFLLLIVLLFPFFLSFSAKKMCCLFWHKPISTTYKEHKIVLNQR